MNSYFRSLREESILSEDLPDIAPVEIENEPSSIPVEETSPVTRVMLDALHAMKRITTNIPALHPMSLKFAADLRDSIFQMDAGDVKRCDEVCREGLGLNRSFKTTFPERLQSNPDWVLKRVRRSIPQPKELAKNLNSLVERYTDNVFFDAKYGVLLTSAARKELNTLINTHVANGICFYSK